MGDKPFKVLHVLPSVAPTHGGPTVAGLAMVRALRRAGADARVVTSDDNVGGTLNVALGRWVEHEGVPTWFLPRMRARQHTLVGFTFAPAFGPWLREHLSEFDVAHIHTVFSFPANSAMRLARRKQMPYAVRPLGQLCRWSLEQRSWVKRVFLATGGRANINGAAFIHTTSEKEAEETRVMQFRSPVVIEPHGTEFPETSADARQRLRVRLGVRDDRPLVIFLSRLHEVKGLEVLLAACAELRQEQFDLVIAGSGETGYVESLKAQARSLGLAERIHWIGFVSGANKWEVLQGGDLFVLPSRSESFGIAVAEALACGLPAIISEHVPLRNDVTTNGLGAVVPLEAGALAAGLKEWLAAHDRRREAGRRAREFARANYSWDATARRLLERYELALRGEAQATR